MKLSQAQVAEARKLHRKGWSVEAIARSVKATPRMVAELVDPDQLVRIYAQYKQYKHTRRCVDCGKRITYMGTRCNDCAGKAASTTARPSTLHCASCGKWKADEKFTARGANRSRRYRSNYCKDCQNAKRKARAAA